jgi:hypothetical protein
MGLLATSQISFYISSLGVSHELIFISNQMREDGDLRGSVVLVLNSQWKNSFFSLVSALHFTPCFGARSMVLRLRFKAAIFGSFVICFFPSIRSWILDPVRRYLGFCHCFIRRLRTSFFHCTASNSPSPRAAHRCSFSC